MTKLQFCLLAYELMGLGNFLYPNNLRLVEEWDLSLNHLTLGKATEVFKRLFIPQISPSHQSSDPYQSQVGSHQTLVELLHC